MADVRSAITKVLCYGARKLANVCTDKHLGNMREFAYYVLYELAHPQGRPSSVREPGQPPFGRRQGLGHPTRKFAAYFPGFCIQLVREWLEMGVSVEKHGIIPGIFRTGAFLLFPVDKTGGLENIQARIAALF